MTTKTPAKLAVITGASAGIGQACAEVFAEHGWALALGARRLDRLAEMAPALKRAGSPDVLTATLDVTSPASIEAFATEVERRFGNVDALVNNAGLAAGIDPVATGKDDDWDAMIDTNVKGLLKVTRRFLPRMIARSAGHIFNMGSIAGFHTYANGSAYAGTKHAVRAITGALRLELAGTNIRVTEIDPGMVETEFSIVRLKSAEKAAGVYQGMTPLTARDVAECVWFAASRPAHVNLEHVVVMPTDQASIYKVHRR
jgi:NADP-dependent 3-hydroxy acid dehydrogenase YdfG